MSVQFVLEALVVLGAIVMGTRAGGVGVGLWGGLGTFVLVFVFREPPGEPPAAALAIILAVVTSAAMMQAVFLVDWYNATKEELFEKAYFPKIPATVGSDGAPVQILTSGPDSQWAAIRQAYAAMIVSAQRRVFLQSPYFIPDTTIAEALRSAALAGVDVRIMLSERPSGDPVPAWATNTFAADILESGVRVFLYKKGYLHAKTISVDSEICSIGSANIDIRSFSINYEINAVFYNSRLASELERDFERDLAHCTEFHAEDYESRGRVLRFRDSVARLLSPLL